MNNRVIVTTADQIPGDYEILGLVHTTVVTSKSLVGDFAANVKNWTVGGELPGYTKMIDAAVETAQLRLQKITREEGGDAIIAFRICSTEVSEGAAEIIAYGTAVKRRT